MKTIVHKGFKGLVAGLLVAVLIWPTPAEASYMDWWNWNFYQGNAHYLNVFYDIYVPGYGSMREFNGAPEVHRSMYDIWASVCDRQAAIQFYLQPTNYWYPYDYSSFRSGCKLGTDMFYFPGWDGMRVPTQTYTHAWWVDANTNGFKLVANGWIP